MYLNDILRTARSYSPSVPFFETALLLLLAFAAGA
ncbi:hypothetical protein SAMN04488047_107120 [Tranquillimonas alkanivorans]|uniref:Uncharacterized protein n=1 Tax=Tranquillimonas alkanivorans TaxID=441119 RepID=A0A1I5QVB1_9RHOB|nr:hypothetical protein SAMN04488047_107120 [Tranquillimonas alkanivorans]